ncbi:Xaa-Pro peptidase family protein [Paenibacillus sp.]|uniref:M24 family metallopeptidase n=1 Tax=Paenibacillus sp. TaxID=58172 RepID=UPI002D3CF961|nr:Xaa-Pro peptidase family protein [Paenibacillus sp.]HZG85107.1 Xaa-Pro peptidase family protein [Paenibacillus sp.]
MAHTEHRLEKLRGVLRSEGHEALLVTNPVNRKYVSGFTGTAGFVVVTADRALLFTDFRYTTQAAEQAKGFEIVEHGASALASIGDALRAAGVKRLGFEQRHVSYGSYLAYGKEIGEGVTLEPTDGLIERLRRIKDEQELEVMRQAVSIADAAFEHILTVLKPGLRERDVALELEMFMRKLGASGSSFDIIVASGERSALPHGVASDRVIGSDEFVKMDFGALYNGYCSDLTRTVVIGKPTAKHREIYDIVLEAQLAALAGIRAGISGREGDALARDVIAKYGYAEQFGHGTGHAVGMDIHESPRLSKMEQDSLEPGMVVTVEPGIYLPGFGGVRIEDIVVVTENGCDVLTKSKKDFITL